MQNLKSKCLMLLFVGLFGACSGNKNNGETTDTSNATGINHSKEFYELIDAKDTLNAQKLLEQWEKEDEKSADLAAAWYNFYYWLAMDEVVNNSKECPNGYDCMEMTDEQGNVAGYIYSEASYCRDHIDKAFSYLDKGIANNPKRLDLYFGKVRTILQMAKESNVSVCNGKSSEVKPITEDDAVDVLCQLLDMKDKSNWLWSENEKIDDNEDPLYESIQTYFTQIVEAQNLTAAERLIDKVLTQRKSLVFRSDKAFFDFARKDYDSALKQYLEILNDFPKDDVVLSNIANCYARKGDKENALKYYNEMSKSEDPHAKSYAEQAIANLQ